MDKAVDVFSQGHKTACGLIADLCKNTNIEWKQIDNSNETFVIPNTNVEISKMSLLNNNPQKDIEETMEKLLVICCAFNGTNNTT